jgi:hypothetical protein
LSQELVGLHLGTPFQYTARGVVFHFHCKRPCTEYGIVGDRKSDGYSNASVWTPLQTKGTHHPRLPKAVQTLSLRVCESLGGYPISVHSLGVQNDRVLVRNVGYSPTTSQKLGTCLPPVGRVAKGRQSAVLLTIKRAPGVLVWTYEDSPITFQQWGTCIFGGVAKHLPQEFVGLRLGTPFQYTARGVVFHSYANGRVLSTGLGVTGRVMGTQMPVFEHPFKREVHTT